MSDEQDQIVRALERVVIEQDERIGAARGEIVRLSSALFSEQEKHRVEVAELNATISGLRAALSAVREVRARQIGDGAQVGP